MWLKRISELVTANVFPNLPIPFTLTMEAIRSYDTSVLTATTRRHIPQESILHSHRHKNPKSYINIDWLDSVTET
jgi:hypothetical protein